MEDTKPKQNTTAAPKVVDTRPKDTGFRRGPRDGRPRKNEKNFREGRAKPEFEQKILNIRRVTRVAAGGRRFNFSVAMVIGDKKGSVGVGIGKAGDTALAIEKAMRNAKRHMVKVPLTSTGSIAHAVRAKYSSARVLLMPAPGRGLIAGSAVRNVVELAGVKDVAAKIFSPSKNKLNIARGAVKALMSLRLGHRASNV